MTKNNFKIKKLISEKRSGVKRFIGEKDGKEYFVKECENEERLEREYQNQKFLCKITENQDAGFSLLEPEVEGNIVLYPVLSGSWMGDDSMNEESFHSAEEYLDETVKFFRFCHQEIEFDDLPEEIKNRHKQKGDQHYLDNFEKDGHYLVEQGVLKKKEQQKLRNVLEANVDKRAFQHHEVVPWHINKQGGQIFLVDAQWADWSLWAYDIAYFILQMIGYAGRMEDARTLYDRVVREYENKENFDELLHCALAYRGMRLAAELYRADKTKNLDKVIEVTKNGGLK